MIAPEIAVGRYRDLQRYVGWTQADEERVVAARRNIEPRFAELIEDFYDEIRRHSAASQVLTGGQAQIERLKSTLLQWLRELFEGRYDETYFSRRWQVGLRHVELGLPHVYAGAAMSRLRNGMIAAQTGNWLGDSQDLALTLQSLNKLLDLDLAIIGDAYETEHVRRQREAERLRLDDLLHREKELSEGLLTHAQAAVLVLDGAGRIVRHNPFVKTLTAGRLIGAIEGRDWFDVFLSAEDRKRVRRALLSWPRHAEADHVMVSSAFAGNAGVRQLHWSGVPLLDGAGTQFGALVVGHDVTDLYEAQQRAVQNERLAAIGEMATGLAHESRNALQRIGASAEMLEMELAGNAAALALVARIEQSKTHLHRLLEEVRSYAAPIVLDRSPIRISEAWREAWELLLAQRRGRNVELRELTTAEDLVLDADRFRLVQVFRNLFDNALAATSDPALIDVFCEPAWLEDAAALRIRVRDNGAGLSEEQRRRIFEPFYTTKPTGTGLGMAIAKRLVESHLGAISVVDKPPPGAEIVVTLPLRALTPATCSS